MNCKGLIKGAVSTKFQRLWSGFSFNHPASLQGKVLPGSGVRVKLKN